MRHIPVWATNNPQLVCSLTPEPTIYWGLYLGSRRQEVVQLCYQVRRQERVPLSHLGRRQEVVQLCYQGHLGLVPLSHLGRQEVVPSHLGRRQEVVPSHLGRRQEVVPSHRYYQKHRCCLSSEN